MPPPVIFGRTRAFSFNPDTWVDRWADFGWQELPMLRKGSLAEATAISDDGLVQVGISTTGTSSAYRAVIWIDGRIRELVGEHEELASLASRLEEEGVQVRPRLLMGPTVEVILDLATEVDAGWIVVASHGRGGLVHLLLGSISEGLVRHSTRPVVVVPARAVA